MQDRVAKRKQFTIAWFGMKHCFFRDKINIFQAFLYSPCAVILVQYLLQTAKRFGQCFEHVCF